VTEIEYVHVIFSPGPDTEQKQKPKLCDAFYSVNLATI
jgi:hypothetical protein